MAIEHVLLRRATVFTPWSRWASDGLTRRGVDPARIKVLPPGVDLEGWRMPDRAAPTADAPLRLLFVGGNFERKGGDLLVDVVRTRLRGRCTLDVVTHDEVAPAPGVTVHRAPPNSPELRRLFAAADLFVMPTRADCFGIACIEAMAAGLPVVMGDVGGARDIVDDGRTGWLIRARPEDLARVLEHASAVRQDLPVMGRAARAVAEERFDGRRNDALVVDLAIEQARARPRR
jgi:glycosyltransferase involved in cell wall biosynthesis